MLVPQAIPQTILLYYTTVYYNNIIVETLHIPAMQPTEVANGIPGKVFNVVLRYS